MKTNQLFKKYYKILNEQDPGPETPPVEAAPPEISPTEPVAKTLDANEKYVIKVLTNAFIFNPTLFPKSKQNFIANKIEDIKKLINVPVSKVVEEIKSILNLDHSLKIESKTLKIIAKYKVLLEQPADATEPQVDNISTTDNISKTNKQPDGTSNNLNLSEIFPLYKELILQSLAHAPTDEELMILKPIVNEFADSDPEKIVTTIKDLLVQESDKDIEAYLAKKINN